MKARLIAAIMLLLLLPSLALATNGAPQPIPVFPKPFGFGGVFVSLGWYNSTQAWFFCAATNNIPFTHSLNVRALLTLSPKLSSALVPRVPGGDIAARPLYLVTNFQNPPVFSAAPGQALYSALWQVFTVAWKPGVKPRPITNAEPASPSNPTGVPDCMQADVVATDVVLDCPILVLGPLTKPLATSGARYIIPQAGLTDPRLKLVFLPAWQTYCQDPTTRRVRISITQITDVGDPALASVLGANLAPGLLNLPDEDTTEFFVMRGPKPLTQLPIAADCPTAPGARNTNFDYSPVMKYVILGRNLPPYALVKSTDYLKLLLGNGALQLLRDDQRINAPTFGPSG